MSSQAELQAIAAAAARALSAPVAMVGVLDGDREIVKAITGWKLDSLPIAASFAARIADDRDIVIVGDAPHDPRLASHPMVTDAPHVTFFAGAPIVDDSGRFLGAISVLDRTAHIVTAEQSALLRALARHAARELAFEEALHESDERFRDFFERIPEFVMSIGIDGRLMHANQATLDVLGFTREELKRTPLLRVIDPEARDAFRRAFSEVFSSGEAQTVETVFVTATGHKLDVEGSLYPKLIDGTPVLARTIFRDISERKQFEADLGSARDAALEAARLKTQFLTNVSHEIRTPMNGIVGMIDLLLSTSMSAEQQDFALQARTSAEQLLSIVNNILYVSNLEAGGLAPSNVDFDLLRTLQRIVEVMKIGALGKDLHVALVYDKQFPPIVRGNQSRIRQIVTNLMENAVKFTEEGSVVLNVTQQTETDTHRVIRFEIRDTGPGISAEDRLLLFERFSQIEASSTRRFGGVGLGLATARQLVETMGGLIDVDSTEGVGSNFWFTIPFPKQLGARKPIASSDLDFKGKRVLLVDHYPTSRQIVRHYLQTTWEMRVDVAETAEDVLAMLKRDAAADPFRVVLFDDMPDMEPLAFAREVQAREEMGGTSLIYLAANSRNTNEERLRDAGVHAFAAKPVGQGELFDALTLALAHDAIPLARPVSSARTSSPAYVPPEQRKSIRVLLAEDNFLNRKLTMSQLEKLGYVADSVGNGKEAVEAVTRESYDVILMDCQMPVMDGYEATMEIRRRDSKDGRKRRIIAMTANALEGDREKCLAAGMDDYLAKPTRHEDLEKALARAFAAGG
ncbi:MAG TPA: response regulator [Thermoanaerobaculia bacterium]|nr:response regulator [Thermoanaerobaculia bacterium]